MTKTAIPLLAGIVVAFESTLVYADPDDYVHVPAVEYGEREIDFKFGTQRGGSAEALSAASLGFGYGVTQWWFTEFYAKVERPRGESTHFDEFELENKFQLTEPGQYWADLGFVVEIERPRDHAEGWEFKLGPLFQKDLDLVQVNFNPLFERAFHAQEPQVTELHYEWQVKYRWRPELEFGAQGFGNLGEWNHWASSSEQEHKLGPAIFGKLALGGRNVIRYNAAWLFGTTDATPHNTFRLQTEYEF